MQCPSHFFHVIEHCKCFPVSLIFFSKLTLVAELPVVAQGGLSASRASFSPGSPSGRAGEPPRRANLPSSPHSSPGLRSMCSFSLTCSWLTFTALLCERGDFHLPPMGNARGTNDIHNKLGLATWRIGTASPKPVGRNLVPSAPGQNWDDRRFRVPVLRVCSGPFLFPCPGHTKDGNVASTRRPTSWELPEVSAPSTVARPRLTPGLRVSERDSST